jgi:hypothetical protein
VVARIPGIATAATKAPEAKAAAPIRTHGAPVVSASAVPAGLPTRPIRTSIPRRPARGKTMPGDEYPAT